jgi:ribosome biogenesis GTPase / thiamine phosphate phosphatase
VKGRVVKATGSWYGVRLGDGTIKQCRMKGKMRLTDRRTTNPVVIGDWVEIESGARGDDDTQIKEVLPRENYIIRQSSKNRTAEHILAANLDQTLLVASIKEPMTPVGFIDRFLVTATAYHVPAIVVFNKIDVYDEPDLEQLEMLTATYESAGYKVLATSVEANINIDNVKETLKGKLTMLSGNSGVGKSSLINAIAPELDLVTGEISGYHSKGTHTTTFAEMFPLAFGGDIIDTPGIKEFGILDFEKEEVSHYFPEMDKRRQECRFNNCIHINEPGCAVLKAVETGEIALTRYNSYIGIIAEIETDEKIYD